MNLHEHIKFIRTQQQSVNKSSLWSNLTIALSEKIHTALLNADTQELMHATDCLDQALHYGFYFNDNEVSLSAKIDHARKERKNIGREIKRINIFSKAELENLGSYVFLESLGLFDEYLELAKLMSFEPDMPSARHFYYAYRLREILLELGFESVRVLEIGAGAGNLMQLLYHYKLVKDYTIIDLPEMLLMSGVNIENKLDIECRFMDFPLADAGQTNNHFVSFLMYNQDMSQLPDEMYDVILNFNSFSEMQPIVVENYFKVIYRTARKGAVFMNVNRIQEHRQNDGRTFKMNPLLFPYNNTDRILMWDVDQFQQFVRQFCRTKPVKSTAIMHISQVRCG